MLANILWHTIAALSIGVFIGLLILIARIIRPLPRFKKVLTVGAGLVCGIGGYCVLIAMLVLWGDHISLWMRAVPSLFAVKYLVVMLAAALAYYALSGAIGALGGLALHKWLPFKGVVYAALLVGAFFNFIGTIRGFLGF